jgi:hypothetical protein
MVNIVVGSWSVLFAWIGGPGWTTAAGTVYPLAVTPSLTIYHGVKGRRRRKLKERHMAAASAWVPQVPFFYQSGEQIKAGDCVLLHGEPGKVEFVADPVVDPNDWYVKERGGGVMIAEPKVFGRLFIDAPVSDYEDPEFESRGWRGLRHLRAAAREGLRNPVCVRKSAAGKSLEFPV